MPYAVKNILVFIGIIMLSIPAFSQFALQIEGKMKLESGSLDGTMEMLENGQRKRISKLSGNGKFEAELDLGKTYIFVFSQDGYVTKKIEVNTRIDPNREDNHPFIPFDFQVTLFEQYEGVSYVIFNQPVAKIFYSAEIDDFDYDTDYTKSIRDQIEQVEKEVEEAKKEQEKLAKEEKKREEEELKLAMEKAEEEEKALLAAEEAAEKEAERKAKEEEEAQKEAEKLAEVEAEKKEKELVAAAALAAEKEEEERKQREEEERQKEELLSQKEEEEKPVRKPPPPVTSNTQVKKEAPPTRPKRVTPPPVPPPTTKNPSHKVVVLHSYTVGELGYPNLDSYGFINFGDGAGRREITKEQFDEYAKIYH